jgi:hypothetical protein
MTSSLHPVATLLPATRRMVTKYRDGELRMTSSPQRFRRLGNQLHSPSMWHARWCALSSAMAGGDSGGVARYDGHVMRKVS